LAGVIFYMDGLDIRPVTWEMGQRLADAGYLVLQPDLYYRFGGYPPKVPSEASSSQASMAELMKWVKSLDRDRRVSDSGAFPEYPSSRSDVSGERFGATAGYCMGGNASLTAAGAFPDRFAAVASFHGGNLGFDKPDSLHNHVKGITGRVYVAGAVEDASFPDEQKMRLEKALNEAGVNHLVETYAGARHGFAVADLPGFNKEAAERHWTSLLKLFQDSLPAA